MIVRREKENNPYEHLRLEALEKIQTLSGNRWTDFNEHDPGVTILDVLHYALLELDYMLQFPFESYLAAKGGSIDFECLGLLPAEKLFTPVVVTATDYEKLILENIDAVKDCRVTLLPNKKYRIEIGCENSKIRNEKQLSIEIEQLYHAHRNLGETLDSIVFGTISGRRDTKFWKDDLQYESADTTRQHVKILFSPEHYSIQNHFPDCYGINEKGMPPGVDSEAQAKIRQLQAYLLIFDYLLAYAKQQVADIPQLLALSGTMPHTKIPGIDIEAVKTLVDTLRFNESVLCNEDFLENQKANYLDMLDTLYGEDTKRFFVNEPDLSVANRKRAELIRCFPQLNALRFRSFNILKKHGQHNNIPGIVQFISAINGHTYKPEMSVVNLFSRYNLRLLSDDEFFREHGNLNAEFIIDTVEHKLLDYEVQSVPRQFTVYDDKQYYLLRNHISLLRHHLLFETFLREGDDMTHYKMANWRQTGGYMLIFNIPGRQERLNLGLFANKETLIETANLLWKFLIMLREQSQQIYLVEHILLDSEEEDTEVLSIVIPHWAKFAFSSKELETFLLERLPAHLSIRFRWLHAEEIYGFEKAYFEWRETLAAKTQNGNK